jgi:uncharacterized membrane protein YbhN (UPF0104 family)
MRKFAVLAVKVILSAGLLYLALGKVDFPALLARLNARSLEWLALAVGLLLLQLFIGALRWREISNYAGAPLAVRQATRLNVIGAFFNQTLPSSIGGDAVRLLLVSRSGAGWRAAAYSVFVDRAVGLIILAVIVVLSMPWSFDLITSSHGRVTLALIDCLALGAGAGFLAFGAIAWSRLRSWRATHHLQACSKIASHVLLSRTPGARVALLSVVVHLLTIAVAWCAAESISVPISFLNLFLLVPPVVLVTMLPISVAGWGVRETAMMVAFGYAGLPQSGGVNVSLLFGAVTFIVGAAGGVLWIFSSEKRGVALPTA